MKLKLAEKAYYRYIYKDKNNQLHVGATINGGEEVGGDNTCQTATAIKGFMVGRPLDTPKVPDVQTVIQEYMADLQQDIAFIEKYNLPKTLLDEKQDLLRQLDRYQNLLAKVIITALVDSFQTQYPHLPDPIHAALHSPDAGFATVLLRPQYLDNATRFKHPRFSLEREHDGNFHSKCFNKIHELYSSCQKNLKQKSPKGILIAKISDAFIAQHGQSITNDTQLSTLKDIAVQVSADYNVTIRRPDKTVSQKDINCAYMADTCYLETNDPLTAWVDQILSFAIDDESIAFQNFNGVSPFYTEVGQSQLFYVKLQLFLSLVNLHCFAKYDNQSNFGQILENLQENPNLIPSFLQYIQTSMQSDFDIEKAIFAFFAANSHAFAMPQPLTEKDKLAIAQKFNSIWSVINGSPHYDEFIIRIEKTPGDLYVLNSQFCVHMARYVRELDASLYEEFFASNSPTSSPSSTASSSSSVAAVFFEKVASKLKKIVKKVKTSEEMQLLATQIPQDEFVDGVLKCTENSGVVIDLTKEQVAELDAATIARNLCQSINGKLIVETISTDMLTSLKNRPDWAVIFNKVLKSTTSQDVLNRFTTAVGAPNCYVLDLNTVYTLYTYISLENLANASAFHHQFGIAKLKTALAAIGFNNADIEANDHGDFIWNLDATNFAKACAKINDICQKYQTQFHLTSAMSGAYYAAAEALSTPLHNIKAELASLNNTNISAPHTGKMARALQHVLHLTADQVVPAGSPIPPGGISLTFHGGNGYIISAQNPQLIQILQQTYYQQFTILLTSQQLAGLFLPDSLPQTYSKENVCAALDANKIPYSLVRHVGSHTWLITTASTESKLALEQLIKPDVIAEKQKIYQTRQKNLSIYEKAEKIAQAYEMSLAAIHSQTRSGKPKDLQNEAATHVVFKAADIEQHTIFIAGVQQLSSTAVVSDTTQNFSISADFIYNHFPGKLEKANSKHPAVIKKMIAQQQQLSQHLGVAMVDVVDFRPGNDAHNAKQPIAKVRFTVDVKQLLHCEIVKLLLAQNTYSQDPEHRKILFTFVQQKGQAELSCTGDALLERDMASIITQAQQNVDQQLQRLDKEKNNVHGPRHALIDPKKINYKVLCSEATLKRTAAYQDDLISGKKQPGIYLRTRIAHLDIDIAKQTREEFASTLFETKRLACFAEREVLGNGLDWNGDEEALLSDYSVYVPVTVFDDGKHTTPTVYSDTERFEGHLVYTVGALLKNAFELINSDLARVVKAGKVDPTALYQLYENRLLPVLLTINQVMADKAHANTASIIKKALITIPGLGCGVFSGDFKATIGDQLEAALERLLRTHVHALPYIKAVYFDRYSSGNASRKLIPSTTSEGIHFICRPFTKSGDKGRAQLCHPSEYEDTPGEFADCEVFSLVAWDFASWVTNDLIRGGVVAGRTTDDGVKGSATDTLTKITGYPGSHNGDEQPAAPTYNPENYATWNECISQEGLTFSAKGRLYVASTDCVIACPSDGIMPHKYHFPLPFVVGIALKAQVTGQTDIAAALQKLNIQYETVTPHAKNGFDVYMKDTQYQTLVKTVGRPYHLKPNVAMLIYMYVSCTIDGGNKKLENLNNQKSSSGGVIAEKLTTALQLMGINDVTVSYHYDDNGRLTTDGYDLMISPEGLKKIEDSIAWNNDELPMVKQLIAAGFDDLAIQVAKQPDMKMAKAVMGIFSSSATTDKEERLTALSHAVKNAPSRLDIAKLLQNQIDLLSNAKHPTVIDPNLCAAKWTTTSAGLPLTADHRNAYRQQLQSLLAICKKDQNASTQLISQETATMIAQMSAVAAQIQAEQRARATGQGGATTPAPTTTAVATPTSTAANPTAAVPPQGPSPNGGQ